MVQHRIEFGSVQITDTAKRHLDECLSNNWISMGPKVAEFEKQWRSLFGYKYARAVSSGTSADIACCLALYHYGAKPGDEVIVPALSFVATGNSVRAAGFTPRFVDVKLDTMNINENKIEEAITPKTCGIMVVNLMGKPAALSTIKLLAKRFRIPLIVDNCEGYGSKHKGEFALAYCDMETSSHYIAHLICCAEGGMVSTNDPVIDNLIQSVRSHGRVGGSLYFDHVRYGLNLKMSDVHASLGLGEVERFWEVFNKRRQNVKYIRSCLKGLEDKAWFTEEDAADINCPHGLSITLKPDVKRRIDDFHRFLDESSINWKRNFGSMPHHDAFDYLQIAPGAYPNARYIGDYGIHVGCHYYLSDDDLDYLSNKLREFLVSI